MKLQDAVTRFETLSTSRKVEFLAAMVMDLTVEARSQTIDLPPEKGANVCKGINELQHSVANQLCAYLSANRNFVRPSQVFMNILQDVAQQFQLRRSLGFVLARAFARGDL